jgi:CRISPR/Cas system CSM-associated protein Csm5 (group 7 of RAMP superfamily)
MGFNFSFFGKQEVRKFNYKPRFYDPEAEERRKKYGDFTKDAQKKEYVPGQSIKGSLRDGNYSRTEDLSKNQRLLGAISLILLFGVIFLLWKYFPILLDSMQNEQQKNEVMMESDPMEDAFKIISVK